MRPLEWRAGCVRSTVCASVSKSPGRKSGAEISARLQIGAIEHKSDVSEEILVPERNNFALVRLLAALGVLLSHALFLRSGNITSEILYGITFYNLGEHAVNVFFVLSGVMVSASLVRSSSFIDFAVARALRIFPALIACSLVIFLFIGPLVTVLSFECYVTSKAFFSFVLQSASATSGAAILPGVRPQSVPVRGR